MSWINSNTELYCSFAKIAGNTGCRMMNTAFYYYRLNKIYKSFSVDNIQVAVDAARVLDVRGFAVTMPYKVEVLSYLDELSDEVSKIGACNTVLNNKGKLTAYNTDVFAAQEMLSRHDIQKPLFILGNGGYSKAVQYAAKSLGFDFLVLTRNHPLPKTNWSTIPEIRNSIVYNCTPVNLTRVHDSNIFIDCLISSKTGMHLATLQASEQFNLYTGLKWPF